jgi:hypothetical protein
MGNGARGLQRKRRRLELSFTHDHARSRAYHWGEDGLGGIRALSKFHERQPYIFRAGGEDYRVDYLPAESNTGMFGGNSNWRGPIWMPVNVILIRALLNFYAYYGDTFTIECPTGSGKLMSLFEVAREIADRLTRIFVRDASGRRPVYGGHDEVSGGSPLARLSPLPRILPRGQRGRTGRESPDRMDGSGGDAHRALRIARRRQATRGRKGCRLRARSVWTPREES